MLLVPGAEETAQAWHRLAAGLHTLLKLKSVTFARPLVPEDYARESIAASLDALRGTAFSSKALRNARAVEEIERQFRAGGRSPALFQAVDDCIEALLDEWDAIESYPEVPPAATPISRPSYVYEPRAAGAG